MPLFSLHHSSSFTGEETTPQILSAHQALLIHTLTVQLGPLAGGILRAVLTSGPLTLKDIQLYLRDDEEMKLAATAPHHQQPPSGSPHDQGASHGRGAGEGSEGTTAAGAATASSSSAVDVDAPYRVPTNIFIDASRGASSTSASTTAMDVAIKEIATRLVLHRVLAFHEGPMTYAAWCGPALLLRVCFPLVTHHVRQQLGEGATQILLVVYQLGMVPLAAAVKVARERAPGLPLEAIEEGKRILLSERWLEVVGADEGSAVLADTLPYRIALDTAVRALFKDAMEQLVDERVADGGLSVMVMRQLLHGSYATPSATAEVRIPSWTYHSATTASLADAVHQGGRRRARDTEDGRASRGEDAVERCLQRLCQPMPTLEHGDGSTPPLRASPNARVRVVLQQQRRPVYSLHYPGAVLLLQHAVCERVLYARHGVLGVRLIKLLLQHHLLEERVLAETAVATYSSVRGVLHHMMRDGLLTQQEVPRSAVVSERAAKSSVFLWGADWETTVLPAMREIVAKALHVAMAKTLAVAAEGYQRTTKSAATEAAAGRGGEEEGKKKLMTAQVVDTQCAVAGLQSSALSLMRLLVQLDLF